MTPSLVERLRSLQRGLVFDAYGNPNALGDASASLVGEAATALEAQAAEIARLTKELDDLLADQALGSLPLIERMAGILKAAEAEIERLKARVAELEGALAPFAKIDLPRDEPDHWPAFGKPAGQGWPTVGHFRRARAVLPPPTDAGGE